MTDRVPQTYLSQGPYQSSASHLRDELARVDLLVRSQVVRWRMTIAEQKPLQLWGMVHVSQAEIEHYLYAPMSPPDRIPESVLDVLRSFWQAETEAADYIHSIIDRTPPSVDLRLQRLCRSFSLSDLERDVVLVCLLAEIDFRYRRIFGYLQDDASRTHPPVELVLQILYPKAPTLEEARAVLEPGSILLVNRIIVLSSADESRALRFVCLDDRIASFLLCLDEVDSRLRWVASKLSGDVQWEQLIVDSDMLAHLQDCASRAKVEPFPVILRGPYGSGRTKAAHAIATAIGKPLLRVDVEAALQDPTRWELLVDLTFREARLLRSALYFTGVDRLQQEDQPTHRWQYLLNAASLSPEMTFFSTSAGGDAVRRVRDSHLVRLDFPLPHYELRRTIWKAHLLKIGDAEQQELLATMLAGAFQFTEGQIIDTIKAAEALAQRRSFSNAAVTREDLYEACRKQAGRRLMGFARRIEPTRQLTIDDVILAEPNKAQLRELLNRVRLRSRIYSEMRFEQKVATGNGLLALFVGPSGTGKTLSAELVANAQGVDLYKVDLSAVVSKWVGETEKNLNHVFAEAEDSDALLFFDECDSLFGQRGAISDAQDRWANLQVNYLLQRVEEYSGVVIMATNLRKNIDEAFLRRIQVIIEFPAPDAGLRFKLWKRSLPFSAADIADSDLRAIAERFNFTGGSVRNVAIDAAFRALAAGRNAITVRDLIDSIAREYQKLGKPITQGDFGEQFYTWVVQDILAPVNPG